MLSVYAHGEEKSVEETGILDVKRMFKGLWTKWKSNCWGGPKC